MRPIGTVGIYYSSFLEVEERDGKYYWNIQSWKGSYWEEIPEYLYRALNRFEDERTATKLIS